MENKVIAQKVSKNLSQLRKQYRYTQKDLADMAGLNLNYYAKVERGESVPSLKTVMKLAKVLKVSATDVVGF